MMSQLLKKGTIDKASSIEQWTIPGQQTSPGALHTVPVTAHGSFISSTFYTRGVYLSEWLLGS